MSEVTLEYPRRWLASLGLDEDQFCSEARLAAAMKLYERGRLSSGQAAMLAGVTRLEFLLSCRQWGVDSVAWDDEELRAEFDTELPSEKPGR